MWLSSLRTRAPAEVRERMSNAILLAHGYAQLMIGRPNVRYVEVFRALQEEACRAGRGCGTPLSGGSATRLTPTCASLLRPPTWTAGTSPTGGSASCRQNLIGSMETGMRLGAGCEGRRGSPESSQGAMHLFVSMRSLRGPRLEAYRVPPR